jgi:hypothetical protein
VNDCRPAEFENDRGFRYGPKGASNRAAPQAACDGLDWPDLSGLIRAAKDCVNAVEQLIFR